MAQADQTEAAVRNYVDAWNKGDRDLFLSLFADDVVQEDPVPSTPNVGRKAVGAFWDMTFTLAERLEFEAIEIIVCGTEAILRLQIDAHNGDTTMRINAVDIFILDDAGKVSSLRAYWDPAKIQML